MQHAIVPIQNNNGSSFIGTIYLLQQNKHSSSKHVLHKQNDCRPQHSGEPVYLVVYRNREDAVCFMEINAVTARLLELVRENSACTASDVLESLAQELGAEPLPLISHGIAQLEEFAELSIVVLSPGS